VSTRTSTTSRCPLDPYSDVLDARDGSRLAAEAAQDLFGDLVVFLLRANTATVTDTAGLAATLLAGHRGSDIEHGA
jgi:hypothetical protein